ncbi:D-arabinono-1,4-lactone oxidase [Pseudoclavibacter helvolus]|uniref:D-arabinono-1,4-lactone oxidase n=1 Tax=Pseudoclavibacter helvolus TaxID=255205 RepID=UPI003C750D88
MHWLGADRADDEEADSVTNAPGELWANWPRTARANPSSIVAPRTAAEVQQVVAEAYRTGRHVRPVGSSHTSNALAAAPDILLDTRGLRGMNWIDLDRRQASFGAGTTIAEAGALLETYGWQLENIPNNPAVTLGGAVSTGSHGTGARFASLSSQLLSATLVAGTGEVVTISDSQDLELWPSVKLSLGALGIFTELVFRIVPGYRIRTSEEQVRMTELVDEFTVLASGADHFAASWRPHTDEVFVTQGFRESGEIADEPTPSRRSASFGALGEMLAIGLSKSLPLLTPAVNKLANRVHPVGEATLGPLRALAEPAPVRFASLEYAFPIAETPEVLRALDETIEREHLNLPYAVRISTTAGDDAYLSNAYGKTVGNITVRVPSTIDARPIFRATEDLFLRLGGLPHWGAFHTVRAEEFKHVLMRFGDFHTARERLDPAGVFDNAHLRRVLGGH